MIATGASQPFPMRPKQEWSAEQVEQRFKEMQREIAGSQNIVVLGGGPTGIEFTGVSDDCFLTGCVGKAEADKIVAFRLVQEVLGKFTGSESKKITLIHRKPQLIDTRAYKKLAVTLEQKLRAAGVDLILGDEHVAGPDFKTEKQAPGAVVRTKQGKEISADYVFLAVGNSPNSQLVADVDPSAIGPSRLINVNDKLQIVSKFFPSNNVFAAGDCCDAPGWRSLISSEAEANTVAVNVLASIGKGAMKKHKAGMRAMIVPLGENNGVSLIILRSKLYLHFIDPFLSFHAGRIRPDALVGRLDVA